MGLAINGRRFYYKTILRELSMDLTDDKSALLREMAWCRQAPDPILLFRQNQGILYIYVNIDSLTLAESFWCRSQYILLQIDKYYGCWSLCCQCINRHEVDYEWQRGLFFTMTSSNGNISASLALYVPFGIPHKLSYPYICGEFTGHRWIPRTKAFDAKLWCFLWSAPE